MSELRRSTISRLREERDELQKRVYALNDSIKELQLLEDKEQHPCSCVKLNGDIEIYDMQEQERRGRVPLDLGLVSECLSARKDCPICKGTGKP